MRRYLTVWLLLCGVANAQPDPLVDGDLKGPAPDVVATKPSVVLPLVPSFELPAPYADGVHKPRALRVGRNGFLGREVTVRGTVTWAYDCVSDVRKPGMTAKQAQQQIDDDPTLCERPKFYVGDSKTTPGERSVWIVDVPRPYNKLELRRIRKPDRIDPSKCEPDETDPKKKTCPPYKVGDEVEITGVFELSSPHSERNSDGLLVFKSMRNVTQRWQSPSWAFAPAFTPPRPPLAPWPMLVRPAPIAIAKVRQSVRNASLTASNGATKAYGQRQWDTAIQLYEKSVAAWKDNHPAWYGLAAAYAQKREWAKARDAAKSAVAVDPTQAMYRLMYGRTIYEAAIASAKEDQARRENVPVDQIEVDLSAVNFEAALLELRHAASFDAALWRPHYLIGSIHRHGGRPKEAATAYAKALQLGATEPAPFVALAELYRAWDYSAQAVSVAELGTQVMVDPAARSDLWLELGMAYEDQQISDKALAAFDKSLDQLATNYRALFARGQLHFRTGELAKAKVDLEAFTKLAPRSMPFFQAQASRMLLQIAEKQALGRPRK